MMEATLRHAIHTAVLAAALGLAAAAEAAPNDILGVWWTPQRDGKIEIYRTPSGTYAGRILATPHEDARKKDVHDPDPALRSRPILGMTVLSGFRSAGATEFEGGRAYDPDSGKSYDASLRLAGPDTLEVRGWIGLPLFGRTETFTRVAGPHPDRPQRGEPQLAYAPRPSADELNATGSTTPAPR